MTVQYGFFELFCFLYAVLFFVEVNSVEQTFADSKKGSWILGGRWNNDLWGGDMPMVSWIDDITPDNPVRSHKLIDNICFYKR